MVRRPGPPGRAAEHSVARARGAPTPASQPVGLVRFPARLVAQLVEAAPARARSTVHSRVAAQWWRPPRLMQKYRAWPRGRATRSPGRSLSRPQQLPATSAAHGCLLSGPQSDRERRNEARRTATPPSSIARPRQSRRRWGFETRYSWTYPSAANRCLTFFRASDTRHFTVP